MFWIRWRDYLEIAVLSLVLYGAGAAVFSRLTPLQRHRIDLQAGLEQLYLIEKAHFQLVGRYFDPTSPADGMQWKWMQEYDWDYRGGPNGFWLVVRADLDGDGCVGAWGIDARSPQSHQLMED